MACWVKWSPGGTLWAEAVPQFPAPMWVFLPGTAAFCGPALGSKNRLTPPAGFFTGVSRCFSRFLTIDFTSVPGIKNVCQWQVSRKCGWGVVQTPVWTRSVWRRVGSIGKAPQRGIVRETWEGPDTSHNENGLSRCPRTTNTVEWKGKGNFPTMSGTVIGSNTTGNSNEEFSKNENRTHI